MRARKERAVAHRSLHTFRALASAAGTRMSPAMRDMLDAATEFTSPRAWWRLW